MHANMQRAKGPTGRALLGLKGPTGRNTKRLGDNVTQSVAAFCVHLQPPYGWRIMQLQTQGERNALGTQVPLLPPLPMRVCVDRL